MTLFSSERCLEKLSLQSGWEEWLSIIHLVVHLKHQGGMYVNLFITRINTVIEDVIFFVNHKVYSTVYI